MKLTYKRLKPFLAALILAITIGAFIYYIVQHPAVIRQLTHIPLTTFLELIGLYILFMLCLAWIQRETLKICHISLNRRESTLLVMYSSIINFFGPLQSGPAFRAAYLKRKHNIKLKQYTLATLLYYGFYALFSAIFIATYLIGPWALLAIVIIIALTPLLLRHPGIVPARFRQLQLQHVANLATATLAQVSVLAIIFYNELNSLGHHVSLIPSLIYTGTANFALFVSITPGAIGFRETFLVFTQRLHDISNSNIVSASLIDRGVYIVFMGLLAAIVFSFHAQNYLKSDKPNKASANSAAADE